MEKVEKDLVGNLQSRHKTILNRIKSGFCDIMNIDFQPSDLCVLPNGLLLISSHYESKLAFFDKNFTKTKEVNHLNRQSFRIFSMATSDDRIFLCDAVNHLLHMTDLECNEAAVVGGKGDDTTQFSYPHGICYFEDQVYVCDSGNNRIQLFQSRNLKYSNTYKLNFKPWQIKISNGIACIRAPNPSCIYFFDLLKFTELYKYEGHSGSICVINSQFYEYVHKETKIICYDETGQMLDDATIDYIDSVWFNGCDGLAYFNSKFLITSAVTGKVILF